MTIGKVAEVLTMVESIPVVIGRMMSPSSFWVSPLPSSPNLDAPEDQCINKVLQLETVSLFSKLN